VLDLLDFVILDVLFIGIENLVHAVYHVLYLSLFTVSSHIPVVSQDVYLTFWICTIIIFLSDGEFHTRFKVVLSFYVILQVLLLTVKILELDFYFNLNSSKVMRPRRYVT